MGIPRGEGHLTPEASPLLVLSSVHFSTMRVLRVPSILLCQVMTQTILWSRVEVFKLHPARSAIAASVLIS